MHSVGHLGDRARGSCAHSGAVHTGGGGEQAHPGTLQGVYSLGGCAQRRGLCKMCVCVCACTPEGHVHMGGLHTRGEDMDTGGGMHTGGVVHTSGPCTLGGP